MAARAAFAGALLAAGCCGVAVGYPTWQPTYKCSGNNCVPLNIPAFRDYKCKYPNCKTFGDYAHYKHGKYYTDPDDRPRQHNEHFPKNWNPEHTVGEKVQRAPDGTLIAPGSDRWVAGYDNGWPTRGYVGPPQQAQDGFPPPAEPVDTKWGGYFPNWGPHVVQEGQAIALPFESDAPENYEVPQGGYWNPIVETNQ